MKIDNEKDPIIYILKGNYTNIDKKSDYTVLLNIPAQNLFKFKKQEKFCIPFIPEEIEAYSEAMKIRDLLKPEKVLIVSV